MMMPKAVKSLKSCQMRSLCLLPLKNIPKYLKYKYMLENHSNLNKFKEFISFFFFCKIYSNEIKSLK